MIIKNFSELIPECIVWEDIAQFDETWGQAPGIQAWLKDKAQSHVETVGYVIAEDDDNIVIAGEFIESDEMYGNVSKIPKSVIRRRVKLIPE
jgi:hypothetical protein